MFEQDVISRMIRDAVRVVMKVLFGKELEDEERGAATSGSAGGLIVSDLFTLADVDRLDEAENALFERLDAAERNGFHTAMLFYAYINEFDDARLGKSAWDRDRIKSGILRAAKLYGAEDFVGMLIHA